MEADLLVALTAHLEDQPLPRLPIALHEALVEAMGDSFSPTAIVQALHADSAIRHGLRRALDSPLLRDRRPVGALPEALARRGRGCVRSALALQALDCLPPEVSIRSGIAGELSRQCQAAAAIAAEVAPQVGLPADDALLAGLLHDVGKLWVLRAVHDYQQAHGRAIPRRVFERLCDHQHEPLGRRLAVAWRLPQALVELIGQHHARPAAGDPWAQQRCLMQFADEAAALLGFAPHPPDDLLACQSAQFLGLTHAAEAWLAGLPQRVLMRLGS